MKNKQPIPQKGALPQRWLTLEKEMKMKSFLTRSLCLSMFLVALAPGAHAAANEPVESHWIDELVNAIWDPIQEWAIELIELSPFAMEIGLVEGEETEKASVSDADNEPGLPHEIAGGIQPIG